MTSAAVSAQGPTQNRVPGKFKLTALQASIGICLAVILFLGTCLCLWWSLDHTVPFWDLAHHAINVMTCSSLLTHPKLFLLDWWRELFCLSPYYPPLYYFVCATINIAVGRLETAQKLTNLLSVSVLVFSLYFLSYKYTKSRLTAAISSILPF